jgi:hypothetical protein
MRERRWRARAQAVRDAGEKRCPRCRQWLSLPAYAASARYLDGHQPVCRRCKREYHLGRPPGPADRAEPQWPPGRRPA